MADAPPGIEGAMLHPRNRRYGLLVATLAAHLAPGAAAQDPELIEIGVLPRGTWSVGTAISDDGAAAAGYCRVPSGIRAFHWTVGGPMVELGVVSMWDTEVYAGAISADGRAVVGETHSFLVPGSHAFRWTAAEGMRDLGYLPGGEWAWANDCSADGAIVVGGCETFEGDRAFRWTVSGGMESLGVLPGGASSSAAAMTPDGLVITGQSDSAEGFQVFRWTASAGMEGLGRLPGAVMATGSDISADGEIIIGSSGDFGGPSRAIVWTRDEGLRELGALPGFSGSQARAISGDGRIIAGYAGREAAVAGTLWLPDTGVVNANDYLRSVGVDLTGWYVKGISDLSFDGSALVGFGTYLGEDRSLVIVGLPIACRPDLDGDGALTFFDFLAFQNLFATGDLRADFDGDGALTLSDFLAFQTAFGEGCP